MDFGIAETGIARGSPPGTTTRVLRFGIPCAEIRVVSEQVSTLSARRGQSAGWWRTVRDVRVLRVFFVFLLAFVCDPSWL
jgi:hypothetical protein